MGVAGCGKSTVAAALAQRLGWSFTEGDAFHPLANIEKMRQGVPLEDADREPWLRLIARAITAWREAGRPGVITCSALRRAYRALIAGGQPDVCFVYLRGSRAAIAPRLAARQGHFMPAALLDSQFAALEEPAPPERFVAVDVTLPLEPLIETVLAELRLGFTLL